MQFHIFFGKKKTAGRKKTTGNHIEFRNPTFWSQPNAMKVKVPTLIFFNTVTIKQSTPPCLAI